MPLLIFMWALTNGLIRVVQRAVFYFLFTIANTLLVPLNKRTLAIITIRPFFLILLFLLFLLGSDTSWMPALARIFYFQGCKIW